MGTSQQSALPTAEVLMIIAPAARTIGNAGIFFIGKFCEWIPGWIDPGVVNFPVSCKDLMGKAQNFVRKV